VALKVVEVAADEEGGVEDSVPAVEGVVVGLLVVVVVGGWRVRVQGSGRGVWGSERSAKGASLGG
jgi:hypothetical protein